MGVCSSNEKKGNAESSTGAKGRPNASSGKNDSAKLPDDPKKQGGVVLNHVDLGSRCEDASELYQSFGKDEAVRLLDALKQQSIPDGKVVDLDAVSPGDGSLSVFGYAPRRIQSLSQYLFDEQLDELSKSKDLEPIEKIELVLPADYYERALRSPTGFSRQNKQAKKFKETTFYCLKYSDLRSMSRLPAFDIDQLQEVSVLTLLSKQERSGKLQLEYKCLVNGDAINNRDCIFVSHRWLTPEDPDPEGKQLADILKQISKDFGDTEPDRELYIWYDFSCMPQKDHPLHDVIFGSQLKDLCILLDAVKNITVESPDYYNRSWCFLESLCRGQSYLFQSLLGVWVEYCAQHKPVSLLSVIKFYFDKTFATNGSDQSVVWSLIEKHTINRLRRFSVRQRFPSSSAKFVKDYEFPHQYERVKQLGTDPSSPVWLVKDRKSGVQYALKELHWDRGQGDVMSIKRAARETKILRFCEHENIIKLHELAATSNAWEPTIFVIMEYLPTDLHQVIHSKMELSTEHIQFIIYQIARGLHYLHSASIIHRDLKPSNMLLNEQVELKIADFGLSRRIGSKPNTVLTEYVATRWYRPPDTLAGQSAYGFAVDMWALGCILGELYLGQPVFPGVSFMNQLERIMSICGTPEEADIDHPKLKEYVSKLPKQERVVREHFKNMPEAALDLLDSLLRWNPAERPTAEQVLQHKFLEALHDPTDEPASNVEFDFDWETTLDNDDSGKPAIEVLKDLVLQEVYHFHPELEEVHKKSMSSFGLRL